MVDLSEEAWLSRKPWKIRKIRVGTVTLVVFTKRETGNIATGSLSGITGTIAALVPHAVVKGVIIGIGAVLVLEARRAVKKGVCLRMKFHEGYTG